MMLSYHDLHGTSFRTHDHPNIITNLSLVATCDIQFANQLLSSQYIDEGTLENEPHPIYEWSDTGSHDRFNKLRHHQNRKLEPWKRGRNACVVSLKERGPLC